MTPRSLLHACAVTVLAIVIVFPSAVSAREILRFANTGGPNDDYTFGCNEFAKRLKELSGGNFDVKVMSNGVLGNDRVVCEMAQQGSLDIALVGQSQFNLFVKPILAMDLPYMVAYENNQKVLEAFNPGGPLYEYVDAEAAGAGLKLLMTLDTPFRSYAFSSGVNVTGLDSVKGRKARVTMSPIEKAFVNALGMNPCPLGWTEVYTALQQGTVDGELINVGTFASGKRDEVEDTILLTRHNMAKIFVVMNRKKFDAYPPEVRAQIMRAATEAQQAEWKISAEFDRKGVEYCKERGVKLIELTPEEKARMAELMKPVYAEYENRLDSAFVQLLKDVQK